MEELILQAIELGHNANQEIIKTQEELYKSNNRAKIEITIAEADSALQNAIISENSEKLSKAVTQTDRDKRKEMVASLKEEINEKLNDSYAEEDIASVIDGLLKKAARKYILDNKKHIDGRQYTEIRPLSSEVNLLPRTHGSGLFSRGQTQVLSITTLGSLRQEQLIDGLGLEDTKRFMHHYNFPPFSTGEAKRLGSTSRREIGHGALAERALLQVIPAEDEFSYTIRIVSEVLSSNGSTSMASVCASTLSLMDAGSGTTFPMHFPSVVG